MPVFGKGLLKILSAKAKSVARTTWKQTLFEGYLGEAELKGRESVLRATNAGLSYQVIISTGIGWLVAQGDLHSAYCGAGLKIQHSSWRASRAGIAGITKHSSSDLMPAPHT